MGKIKAIIVLGIVLATLPYWSIPKTAMSWLTVLIGLVIAILGILFRRKFQVLEMPPSEVKTDSFTQNNTPKIS